MGPARLYTGLSVANLLQHASRILQILREQILLLRDFCHQYAELVTDVTDGVVLRTLTPVAELRSNALRFPASGLVGADGMVLGLDELVQALGKLRLWNICLVLLRNYRLFSFVTCCMPRRLLIVKRCFGADLSPLSLFFERIEAERFLHQHQQEEVVI